MLIQWFPGHMAKAKREIADKIKLIDIVVELVDARAPYSSKNPLFNSVVNNKPRLIVMTKEDLADDKLTQKWLDFYKSKGYYAISVNLKQFNEYKKIILVCKEILKDKMAREAKKGLKPRAMRAMVLGIPNVGKSTIFNSLTGMHQHTGNWPGKTVANATGDFSYNGTNFLLVDIPGTYSILSTSEEEEIARDYICFGKPDCTIIVVDATCLERNLNLVFQVMEITNNVILCVNLLDEAKKKKIKIDLDKLSSELGIPVVGTTARKKKTLTNLIKTLEKVCDGNIKPNPKKVRYSKDIEKSISEISNILEVETSLPKQLYRWVSLKLLDGEPKILNSIQENFSIDINKFDAFKKLNENFKDVIVSSIMDKAEKICKKVCTFENENYSSRDRKIDKILTSKYLGFPIMILFLGLIFWLTIVGANYPSQILFSLFEWIQEKLFLFVNWIGIPDWISNMLILGIYQTLTWVISVMLPPMAIFFPLFTILEDLGYLPRIAFNMDGFFKKCCCTGKQMITMCMGFGCNAAGCVGCRIINSPRERLIAIITNNFVPCNGRFPFLIAVATIFIAGTMNGIGATFISTLAVIFVILLGIFLTLLISKI